MGVYTGNRVLQQTSHSCITRLGTLNVHVPRHMTMTIHMIHMNARMNSLHLVGLFYTHDGTWHAGTSHTLVIMGALTTLKKLKIHGSYPGRPVI